MNKIILVTVLLVALSVVATATKAKIDEAKFQKCLEDELDGQVKVEIPTEVRLAREHFDSLGIDRASHDQLQEYKATLGEEQQDSLVKAANKYIDETVAVIFDGPCVQMEGYFEWTANRKPQDATRSDLLRFRNLALRIVTFLSEDD